MPHTCKARHVCITWATSTSWGPVSQLFPFMLSTIAQKWTLEGLHFSYWQMWKLTWDSHITWWNHVHKLITVFTNIPIWSIIVIISPSLCDPGDGGKFDDFKLSSANSCLPPPHLLIAQTYSLIGGCFLQTVYDLISVLNSLTCYFYFSSTAEELLGIIRCSWKENEED